jgi:adenylosuccinate synthase
MVIHLPTLLEEIQSIQRSFDANILDRIHISSRAHIVFDFHQQIDNLFDSGRVSKLGTSQKGIGPTYSTKTIRNGLRMGDLFSSPEVIREKLSELTGYFTKFHPELKVDVDEVLASTLTDFQKIQQRVVDTVALMDDFMKQNMRVVCEGSNSVMSDIDFGTYPYVTSSNTTPGSASLGLGIPPTKIGKVIGVCKAYTTRAQHWFPSEITGDVANTLVESGHEIGTTSEKPRRVGWIDLVQVKYAADICGFDSLFITKLDALSTFDQIGVVSAYEGVNVEEKGYPSTIEEFKGIKPIVTYVDGWKSSLTLCKCMEDLPPNAKHFLETIRAYVNVPIEFAQIGSQDTILTNADILRVHTY